MNCVHCQAPLVANAKFCGHCGQPVAVTAVPEPAAPPASASTPGPIIQAGNRLVRPLVLLAIVSVLAVCGLIGWQAYAKPGWSDTVSTECHSFTLSEKMKLIDSDILCNVSAESGDSSVAVSILPAEITMENLEQIAEQHFKYNNPGLDIVSKERVSFAGRPAVRIDTTEGKLKQAHIYMYDEQAKIRFNKNDHHAFLVTFGSKDDLEKLVSTAQQDWRVAGQQ